MSVSPIVPIQTSKFRNESRSNARQLSPKDFRCVKVSTNDTNNTRHGSADSGAFAEYEQLDTDVFSTGEVASSVALCPLGMTKSVKPGSGCSGTAASNNKKGGFY